jgi:hypothetical protein
MKSLVGQASMKLISSRNTNLVRLLRLIAFTSAMLPVLSGGESKALTFNFNYAPDTSPEVMQGFEDAANLWSSLLVDDVTVNIDVRFEPRDPNSLGQFNPSRINVSYEDFYNALLADVTSPDDAIAVANLPQGVRFSTLVNTEFDLLINATKDNPDGVGSLEPYVDSDGGCNNRSIRLTTANAKALNLPTTSTIPECTPASTFQAANNSDGYIILNSLFEWDFDASDGIDDNKFDFVGIAAQGIGTILGFVSGVDVLDFNSPQIGNDGNPIFFDANEFSFVSPIDLYRYSEESCTLSTRFIDPTTNQQQNIIDWTTGRPDEFGNDVRKFFSIDGCSTEIAEFSTGITKGDGNRAGSWKSSAQTGNYLGIMDASPSPGQLFEFTRNDQRIFDVIGWDLADPSLPPPSRNIEIGDPGDGDSPVAVPEPSAKPIIVMFGLLGAAYIRAKRKHNI